jgi:adenine-specific DNA-methyltransferase
MGTSESFKTLVADNRIWFGPNGDSMPRTKRFLSEVADRVVPVTWLPRELSGDNQGGKRHLKGLFPEVMDIFETPKPVDLIKSLTQMFCEDDATVLDFFAGTGTTAEAVLSLNAIENAKRRFIVVQLPEPMQRPGFKSIADLTKERIRRAAAKVRAANPLFGGDFGFRVFKLDSSNIRAWNPGADDMAESLLTHAEHLLPGRTDDDVLAELLLKLGLDLCVPTQARAVAGKQLQSIAGGVLIACLDPNIQASDVEPLANGIIAWHKELAPAGDTTCVFRDSAFADDVAKTNMAAILEQNGIANVRSL